MCVLVSIYPKFWCMINSIGRSPQDLWLTHSREGTARWVTSINGLHNSRNTTDGILSCDYGHYNDIIKTLCGLVWLQIQWTGVLFKKTSCTAVNNDAIHKKTKTTLLETESLYIITCKNVLFQRPLMLSTHYTFRKVASFDLNACFTPTLLWKMAPLQHE